MSVNIDFQFIGGRWAQVLLSLSAPDYPPGTIEASLDPASLPAGIAKTVLVPAKVITGKSCSKVNIALSVLKESDYSSISITPVKPIQLAETLVSFSAIYRQI